MRRLLCRALLAGSLAADGFAPSVGALAGESYAEGSATTRAAACKLALTLARQDVPANRVGATRCDCLEDKDDLQTPWSCTAFVKYR